MAVCTTAEADARPASTMNSHATPVTNSDRAPTLKVCVMPISPHRCADIQPDPRTHAARAL